MKQWSINKKPFAKLIKLSRYLRRHGCFGSYLLREEAMSIVEPDFALCCHALSNSNASWYPSCSNDKTMITHQLTVNWTYH